MKKAHGKYVYKHDNGIFYFRRVVPTDLKHRVAGKQWKVSLETREEGLAFERAAKLSRKIENQIAQLRGEGGAADPIDPDVPASDEQVLARIDALLSRSYTIRTGRRQGRIESGITDGEKAQQLLDQLVADLDKLRASTPLALDPSAMDRLVSLLETETGREIRSDRRLFRKLATAFMQNEKRVLENQIAQLRGDYDTLERLSKERSPQRDLQFLVDLYRKQKGAQWRDKTRTKFENISRVLLDILGANTKISAVDRETARSFSDTLHALPTNYSKRKALSGLSARDAATRGTSLGMPTLGHKSLKVYLAYSASLFEFAVNEDLIPKNPMRGLQVRAPIIPKTNKKPSPEDIRKIFSAPIFTGCVDDTRNWRTPGPNHLRRGRFWVPVIALHSGMRLGEICSLQAKDIQTLHDVSLFNLVDTEERRLKTNNAARVIPIHHQLKRIGFLAWMKRQQFAPDDFLFAELPLNSVAVQRP